MTAHETSGTHDALHRRVVLFAAVVVVLSLVIAARLVQLQVGHHEGLQARAREQHRDTVEVAATRGAILDREGRVLALSVATQALFAHPWGVDDPERVARLLAPVLQQNERGLLERLRSDRRFVYLDRFLDPEQVQAVRDLGLPVGGGHALGLLPMSKRVYPRGKLGVHVVGVADIDSKGIEGIEKQFDGVLQGDPSTYLVLRDGKRGGLRRLVRAPERGAADIVLTLDMVLQHLVERELDLAMRDTGAEAASAILVDPATGQVLALANRPAADPNAYGKSSPESRTNRAAVHQYEPGSTFKIVPMAAALEQGTVRPQQRFDCENGSYRLRHRTIRDTSEHGVLSASQILQRSSNIGMVKIGSTLRSDVMRDYISAFGFGRRLGIELPGELRGTLHPLENWTEDTRRSVAFGYEIGVTVLQMASAVATLANDGVRVPLRVALGTRDAEGLLHPFPAPPPQRILSRSTVLELNSMLERAVTDGTGRYAQIPGYRIAGKSGTAKKVVDGAYSSTEYFASFGGFGPVGSPRLACLVVLDGPRRGYYGGELAAPVFARIMSDALRHLRAPADDAPRIAQRRLE